MIQATKWKGKRIGKVGVSKKHALILVKYEPCEATELMKLSESIQKDVYQTFQVQLQIEPNVF